MNDKQTLDLLWWLFLAFGLAAVVLSTAWSEVARRRRARQAAVHGQLVRMHVSQRATNDGAHLRVVGDYRRHSGPTATAYGCNDLGCCQPPAHVLIASIPFDALPDTATAHPGSVLAIPAHPTPQGHDSGPGGSAADHSVGAWAGGGGSADSGGGFDGGGSSGSGSFGGD